MSPTAFNEWSASVTSLAVAILWQSTLLAGVVGGICWLLKRSAPAVRYWCWQVVALKLLLMPWWIVAVPLPDFLAERVRETSPRTKVTTENRQSTQGPAMDRLLAPAAEGAGPTAHKRPGMFDLRRQLTWRSWLVLAWLAGLAWQIGLLLVQHFRLRRLLRDSTAVSDRRLLANIEDVAARLRLSRRPDVVLTQGQGVPFVSGLLRPVLALPHELVTELDAGQLHDVLLHELGHLKRRDLWWGWLPALARMIYFYHPVAHWVSFRIRLERELACDQLAMAVGGRSAAQYAEVLFQVVSRASMPAIFATSSFEALSTFWRRRLTMLVSTSQSSPHVSRIVRLGLVSAALAVCLLPTFERAPAQAQAPNSAKTKARIYVSASYRKTEGAEEKTVHNAIIAIDPATGDWEVIVENGHSPRLSPDGRTLVFGRYKDGVWKCEADGQFPFKISDKDGRPVWSADGKQLVLTDEEYAEKGSEQPSTKPVWHDETWRLDADGRNPVQLNLADTDAVADWSPDGEWFVVTSDRHAPFGRGYQLYLTTTDGSKERRLTEGGLNVFARFSPDGKKIMYLHQTGADGNSIWTVDVDGENEAEIINEVNLASPDGAFWSPDGKQIAVVLFNWELDEKSKRVIHDVANANFRIEIMDVDGTNRRQLMLSGAKFLHIGSLGDWR